MPVRPVDLPRLTAKQSPAKWKSGYIAVSHRKGIAMELWIAAAATIVLTAFGTLAGTRLVMDGIK